jgi:hypothetical protein
MTSPYDDLILACRRAASEEEFAAILDTPGERYQETIDVLDKVFGWFDWDETLRGGGEDSTHDLMVQAARMAIGRGLSDVEDHGAAAHCYHAAAHALEAAARV